MPPIDIVNSTVPLTAAQKSRLATKFFPVVFFVLALIFVIADLPSLIGQPAPVLLPIFLVLVLLLTSYEASKSLRDLLVGVALVEEDKLIRSWHSRGSRNTRYGKFERLGKLRLMPLAFRDAHGVRITAFVIVRLRVLSGHWKSMNIGQV